jgi:hypothetical protein
MFQVSDLFGISVDTLRIYRLLNLMPCSSCMVNYPQFSVDPCKYL